MTEGKYNKEIVISAWRTLLEKLCKTIFKIICSIQHPIDQKTCDGCVCPNMYRVFFLSLFPKEYNIMYSIT